MAPMRLPAGHRPHRLARFLRQREQAVGVTEQPLALGRERHALLSR
jgi:hypothetical protein